MPGNDLVQIQLTKIIPAQKWKVIRLLTKVWEFPAFIPNIIAVTVLARCRNTIRTRWRIQLEGMELKWTEEETFAPEENAIYFKAVEGDLRDFKGQWRFFEHPEGTKVELVATVEIAIPGIQEFAENYVRQLLRKNFEAMLEAFERKLISRRYHSYRQGDLEKIAGFAIIGHPYNFRHLESCFKMLNPKFQMPSFELVNHLFHISPSFKLYDIPEFKAASGQTTNGCFIIATFIPDMIDRDVSMVFNKVVRACKIAEKHGMGIVTLGGFTSIVGERIGHQVASEVDIPVTTGNTFTAAMTIEGVCKAAALMGKDLAESKVVIVGGTGDIGSGCSRVLAGKVRQLTITGRTRANLRRLHDELRKRRKAEIAATTDNRAAVRDADIVIAVASATSSILDVKWFKPGAIICDVGYPKNISYAPVSRDDILIFSGGLATTPMPLVLPLDLGLPSEGVLYGCFAEGIILALERRFENYSFGRGNITPEKIEEIRVLGQRHGFLPADFYWGHKLIDEQLLNRIKDTIKGAK